MLKKGNEIPTIDCALVTIKVKDDASGRELALDTANKIEVEVQTSETEAIKLVIKNKLKAQKGQQTTITGHRITLTDNVFIPELAVILQGGKITWEGAEYESNVTKYESPVAGSGEKGKVFDLIVYSAIYDEAAVLVGYEKITYPNCQGQPFGLNSEDNVFRVSEYTIDSAPNEGQAPYTIEYVSALPDIT